VVERGFKDALNQVTFATSIDETRPILTGVYFLFDKEGLVLAATDSYRLAEKKTGLKVSKLPLQGAVVPAKAVIEVARLADQNKTIVYLSENQIIFEVGSVRITSRLIDGEYPNYQEIMPKSSKSKATCSVDALISLLRAASLFTKEGGGVKLDFTGNKVIVKASASQLGEFESSITVQLDGPDVEVGFNPQYLIDGLTHARSDEVMIEMSEKTSPVLIKPLKDESFSYIAMPLRA
jgi:DNA polymerase-3 subunit beta